MIFPIDKESIPYRFEIELVDELFAFEVHYNETHDFFTIDLYKNNIPLVYGDKLVLNRPLFEGIAHKDLPKITIVPRDRSDEETRITYENLTETIFLYVEWSE